MSPSGPSWLKPLAAAGLPVRLNATQTSSLEGFAASVEPRGGDPELLSVWLDGKAEWHIDRRSTRILVAGDDSLDADIASRAADLADRAQLALGEPVAVRWAMEGPNVVLIEARPLAFVPRFTTEPFHRVSLLEADDGVVAPLAVEAMAKAMRRPGESTLDESVRRIYARPYRRITSADESPYSFSFDLDRLGSRVERVLRDLALPLFDADRFDRKVSARLSAFDARPIDGLDMHALLAHLRDCERVAIESYELLDRVRHATGALVPLFEALTGGDVRAELELLAAPRVSSERRRAVERLQRLAARIARKDGTIPAPANLAPAHRRAWDGVRGKTADVRDLGLDVRPSSWGESDEALHGALEKTRTVDLDAAEKARRDAYAALLKRTHRLSLALPRDVALRSLAAFVSKAATTKGEVADSLARSLLRLKRAALVVGARLVDRGVLDAPEDAVFLGVSELHDAAGGEPGAYAARVRLRREDDARWCKFAAPERMFSID